MDKIDGVRFLELGIKCCMLKKSVPCGFYLYPRSSISKTKMRMFIQLTTGRHPEDASQVHLKKKSRVKKVTFEVTKSEL